uniref:CpsD/CapB family tyrosine-protein kinase n=1 Tax=Nocardioides alkalitolerans TaxID=281714 RepID=UPI0012F833BE
NTIKNAEEVTSVASAPLLGAIAFDGATKTEPLVTSLPSHAPRAEAFRVLRTNLQFVDVDAESKIFVVTSALPSEGKTTTSVNLAITLAQAGQRVLLIEGDLRRPKALEALNIDAAVGVTTVLVGKVSFPDAIQKHSESDLHVLGAGAVPPNPAELLQSRAMADLLSEARSAYDIVIIDAPPLLPVTDAALITAQSDGALLIVRHGKTTRDQLTGAVDRLQQVGGDLVGVVMNMVPTKRGAGYGDGYGYGYGYGYAPQAPATAVPTRRSENTRRGRRASKP